MDLVNTVRKFFMKLLNIETIEEATGLTTLLSAEMRTAVEKWAEMYAGCAPWHKDSVQCGVEKSLAGALSMPVGQELRLKVYGKPIEEAMMKLNEESYKIIEYFTSFGSCVLRPMFSAGRLQYELIPLGNYLPTSYDIDGTLTGAAITKHIDAGKKKYLLVEQHEYSNGNHSVTEKLYEQEGNGSILKAVPLTATPQTAQLTESFTWEGVERPFIIEFRNRETNRIDGSNVPVALISGAEGLIKDADEQYTRMIWEQEAGKMRVFADQDLFRTRQGKDNEAENVTVDPKLRNVFVKLNGDTTDSGQKITPYAPALRTDSQKAAMQEILKRIELAVNVGKGTLSELEQVQQTATQFSGGRKAFYSKVDTYESELEEKYTRCAYVFAYMASAYTGVPFNDTIEVSWADGLRKDPVQERQLDKADVAAGLMNKYEYRMKWYGEDEATAKANVPQQEESDMFGNM